MTPERIYDIHDKHYLSIDCVIFGYEDNQLKVLLYPRGFAPSFGQWSLLGGFVRGNETLGDAARRILLSTTGLENIYQEQVHAFSKLDRDPAGRVISVAYYALIRISEHNRDLVREHGAHWWPINKLPKLIFDHKEMIDQSLNSLQRKASLELLGRELLEETFTLTQLKNLYEAIFMRELDSSNFRKKIHSLDVLQKTAIKDKSDSKRGSYLFKYKEPEKKEEHQVKIEPIIRM
jgi:8-oxo-dGTP diphosphatase